MALRAVVDCGSVGSSLVGLKQSFSLTIICVKEGLVDPKNDFRAGLLSDQGIPIDNF